MQPIGNIYMLALTVIRQSYWIPSARWLICKPFRHYVIYWEMEGRPNQAQDPPPLIKGRVQETHPFDVTIVDY